MTYDAGNLGPCKEQTKKVAA